MHLPRLTFSPAKVDDPARYFLDIILHHAIADMLIITDTRGKIRLLNQSASAITGPNAINTALDKVFAFSDKGDNQAPLFPQLTEQTAPLRLNRQLTINNERHDFLVQATPVSDGFLLILRDTTRTRSLENERHEFISIASHELRTPLTIADGWLAAALTNKSLDEQQKQVFLQRTRDSIKHLKAIVNDLTTLDKAEQGILEVEITNVDIREILTRLSEEFSPQAEAKGLSLLIDISADIHPVLTSEYRITEILRNYIDNAIKFTEKGSIVITATPAEKNGLLLRVQDTGVGIPASEQDKVFTTFFQSETVEAHHSEGTGLGLYIAQQLAARLDAHVWFTSTEGQGSTFYLQVPAYTQKDRQQVLDAAMADLTGSI